MTKTAQGGKTLSAKELASYEWKGMRDEECRTLFEGSESIKVTVGTESNQKTWYLPKKALTHHSPYFNAALNGNFVEANSKAVDLPEDDPIAFEMWATWLSVGECEGLSDYGDLVVRAWKLGDKLACPAFKDCVMFQLIDWWSDGGSIAIGTIRFVYEGSSPGSKLRRFIVDAYMWDKLNGHLKAGANEVITLLRGLPEFLEDTVKQEMKAGIKSIRVPWEEKDRYYENPAFKPDA